MTKEQALDCLDGFLQFGKERCVEILETNTHFTTEIDFSIESLPPVFAELLNVLKTVRKEPDPTLPEFIRQSDTYKQNLFEFDEPSKPIILAAAYYLGETFILRYENLSWSIGNSKFHQCNMPVIKGFYSNQELPAILVTENIFGSIFAGMKDVSSIETTIETWKTFAEQE
jgi:hypothetical protein